MSHTRILPKVTLLALAVLYSPCVGQEISGRFARSNIAADTFADTREGVDNAALIGNLPSGYLGTNQPPPRPLVDERESSRWILIGLLTMFAIGLAVTGLCIYSAQPRRASVKVLPFH
jgi:hypothetical protein